MVEERKQGINDETGLPHEMTLSEVFDNIRLAPTEIATLLTNFGASFHGGPQQPLATKLQTEAARLVNPDTYSNKPQRDVDPRNLDAQGREITPRRDVAFAGDIPPSTSSLNPGGFTAVPVDQPAHVAYEQREPRVADPGAENPRVALDAPATNPNVPNPI